MGKSVSDFLCLIIIARSWFVEFKNISRENIYKKYTINRQDYFAPNLRVFQGKYKIYTINEPSGRLALALF